MSYSGCNRVAELVTQLVNSASSIDALATGVVPGSAAYVRWLSSGCSLIEARLKGLGYDTPVPGTAAIYDYIADLEATYAAYRAELSRASARVSQGERTRADGFYSTFTKGLDMLATMDLSRMGMTNAGKVYSGGQTQSDKDIDAGNSDMIQPRFARGAFSGDFSSNPNTAAS
jgi:hypothetical protein